MIATQSRARPLALPAGLTPFRRRFAGQTLAAAGPLRVVLAEDAAAVRAAQRLRHAIFFGQAAGVPGIEIDAYDDACQHLLLIDDDAAGRAGDACVAATCRLLHQADAGSLGFYSAQEFNLDGLLAAHAGSFAMEVGRVCIRDGYRHRRAVDLLWRAIWIMAQRRQVGLMFGCASLPGMDLAANAGALALVQRFAVAPEGWGLTARADKAVAREAIERQAATPAALADLPPLLKTYLRLGAHVAKGAVVDPVFGTTDVFVALRLADVGRRYAGHFMV